MLVRPKCKCNLMDFLTKLFSGFCDGDETGLEFQIELYFMRRFQDIAGNEQ